MLASLEARGKQLSGGPASAIWRHIKASILGQIREAPIDEMRRVGTLFLGEEQNPFLPDRPASNNQAAVSPLSRGERLGSPLFCHDSANSIPPMRALGTGLDSSELHPSTGDPLLGRPHRTRSIASELILHTHSNKIYYFQEYTFLLTVLIAWIA
jgi:hypothetical protein